MQICVITTEINFLSLRRMACGVSLLAIFLCMNQTSCGEETVRSNSVEVNGIRYTVVNQKGVVCLQSEVADGSGEASISPIKGIPEKTLQIKALKLDRWWRNGIALVYSTTSEEGYAYTLAIFPSFESEESYRIAPEVWKKEFLKSEVFYKFITIEGQHSGDSIVIVLGNFQLDAERIFRKFSQGYVYIDDCPQPPSSTSLTPIGNH